MLASAAIDVERKSACGVASRFGIGKGCEQFPDVSENARIRCRVGARCFAYRALVYTNDLVHVFDTLDTVVVALLDVRAHKRV